MLTDLQSNGEKSMKTSDAIEKRRATKRFDPAFAMPESDVKKLLDLAIKSPTAFNIQHWRFVVVRDVQLREKIRAVSWMQPQITDASLLIIICADLQAWRKNPERYWRNASEEAREGILGAIGAYYEGNAQLQRDEAMRSCGIAAQTIMLAATEMGYATCPMDLSDLNEVGELINLPGDHVISMFVAVGKGVEEPWPRGGQLQMPEVMVIDKF
jgi:nitroreductase